MLNKMDRIKIFWLLKRSSSLAYWKHVAEFQQSFLDNIELIVKKHPKNDPSELEIDIYKRSLDDQINLDQAINRLSVGDRSVFHRHAEGLLTQVGDASSQLLRLLDQNACSDYPDLYITNGTHLQKLAQMMDSLLYWGGGIFEPEADAPAARYATWLLLDQNLPEYAFPNPLPEVPEAPEPPVAVKTGEEVPVDGIYEPEGEGTCMNYLLGGTTAPTVTREYGELHESPLRKGEFIRDYEDIPTTWRLIWADHRYEDGTVPEEEKDYFLPKPKGAVAAPLEATGRALPGDRCPRAGFWYTHAKEGSRRRFEEGEVFPDFPDSAWGATIWYLFAHRPEEGTSPTWSSATLARFERTAIFSDPANPSVPLHLARPPVRHGHLQDPRLAR